MDVGGETTSADGSGFVEATTLRADLGVLVRAPPFESRCCVVVERQIASEDPEVGAQRVVVLGESNASTHLDPSRLRSDSHVAKHCNTPDLKNSPAS